MDPSNEGQQSSRQSYLARHGIPIAISSVLSCALTLAVVFGIRHYSQLREQHSEMTMKEDQRRQLELSLLGKWELIESTSEPITKPGEREWIDFQANGLLKTRWFEVVKVNGEVASKSERFSNLSYKVADVDRLIYNIPNGAQRELKCTLHGDDLTLVSNNGIEKYKRIK